MPKTSKGKIAVERLQEIHDCYSAGPYAQLPMEQRRYLILRDIEALMANPRERFVDRRAVVTTLQAEWLRVMEPDGTCRARSLTWQETARALADDPVRGPQCGLDPQRDEYDIARKMRQARLTVRRKGLGMGGFSRK